MSRSSQNMDGLSIIAGAAHRHDAKDRLLRSSFKHSMGSASASTPGDNSPRARPHTADSSRPKLVQGDYTYTTARRNLTIASQQLGADLLPAEAVLAAAANGSAGAPLGVPSLRPASASANATNMAAWKAYGSPAARGQPRPAPAPPPSHVNTNPHMFSSVSSKPPRVQALGGGFRLQRPHSAPSTGPGNGGVPYSEHHYQHHHLAHTHYAAQPGSPSSPGGRPPRHPSSPTRRQGRNGLGPRGATLGPNPAVLGVEVPDVLGAGKTDSGKVMFEHTLPTDPYSKFLWEEQARKARASMSRHIANMAVAASVNGGGGSSGAGAGGGGGSRPASALRTGSVPATPVAANGAGSGGSTVNGWTSSPMSTVSAVVAGGGAGNAGVGMRARFSSATIAAMQRKGPDHRPHLVVGFAAPDIAEDTTLPGPGDPRWAYTRLGRTQIDRLQAALKMTDPSLTSRPTSAPALALRTGGRGADLGAGGWGITGGSGATLQELDSPGLPPVSERPEEEDRVVYMGGASGRVPRFGDVPGAAGGAGLDIAHSPRFAGGDAPPLPPRRPSSGSAQGGLSASVSAAVAAAADVAGSGPVGGVRGSSAGRGRELAPNPRVDLRAYLADEQAEAREAQAEVDAEAAEAHALAELQAEAAAAAADLAEHGISPLLDGYPPEGGAQDGLEAAAQGHEAADNPYMHGAEAMEADAAVQAATAAVAEAMQSIPVPADDLAAKLAAVAAEREDATEGEELEHGVASVEGGAEESAPEQRPDADVEGAQRQAVQQRHADAGGEDALRALHGGGPARPHGRYGAAADAADEYGDGSQEGEEGGTDGDLGIAAGDEEAAGDGGNDSGDGYGEAVMEDDGAVEGEEDVALGSLPLERAGSLGSRRTPSGHLRPTSARPTSARPTSARPGAGNPLSPTRGGSGRMQRQGSGVGAGLDAGFDVGMDVIHEHSETAAEIDM